MGTTARDARRTTLSRPDANLHRVFQMVIHQWNRPAFQLDAVQRQPRHAALPIIAGARLRDVDVVDRLAITIGDLARPVPRA